MAALRRLYGPSSLCVDTTFDCCSDRETIMMSYIIQAAHVLPRWSTSAQRENMGDEI